jgi:hypothetical protein
MLWLLFAHFLADYALQNTYQATAKGKDTYVMLAHCAIWTGTVALALAGLGLLAPWKVAMLLVGHYACDTWKARRAPETVRWWHIWADQCFHFAQLAATIL